MLRHLAGKSETEKSNSLLPESDKNLSSCSFALPFSSGTIFLLSMGKSPYQQSKQFTIGSFLLLRFTCLPVFTHTQVKLTVLWFHELSFSYSVFCASGAFPYLTNIWSLFKVKVKTLSGARLFATMWTVAFQAPLATGLSRWEYWSGVPLPSPGDLPNPGIQPGSPPLQADSAVRATRESQSSLRFLLNVISSLLSWYSQAKWGVFNL